MIGATDFSGSRVLDHILMIATRGGPLCAVAEPRGACQAKPPVVINGHNLARSSRTDLLGGTHHTALDPGGGTRPGALSLTLASHTTAHCLLISSRRDSPASHCLLKGSFSMCLSLCVRAAQLTRVSSDKFYDTHTLNTRLPDSSTWLCFIKSKGVNWARL